MLRNYFTNDRLCGRMENFMLKQAPVAKRFLAFLIDWYLSTLIGSLPVIIIRSFQYKDLVISISLEGLSVNKACMAGFLALITHFIYYCLIPYKSKGQTLGWRLFGLKLLTLDKTSVSLKTMTLRHMAFVVLLQGYLTSSNIYIITLIKIVFNLDIIAYFQTFYYLTSLISLIIYFKSKGSQLLHDKFTGTILCEMILEQKSKK